MYKYVILMFLLVCSGIINGQNETKGNNKNLDVPEIPTQTTFNMDGAIINQYREYFYRDPISKWFSIGNYQNKLNFFIADDEADLNVNRAVVLTSDGNLGIGTINPNYRLDIGGDINFSGTLFRNGIPVNTGSSSSLWSTSGNDIFYNNGNVGIGTSDPSELLHIAHNTGSFKVFQSGNIGVGSDGDFFIPTQLTLNIDGAIINQYREYFYRDSGSKWFSIANYQNRLNFFIADDTSDTNLIRSLIIDESGNIGMGTVYPDRKVHIVDVMRLEPRTSAPTNAEKGDIYFGTDGKIHIYNGTSWYSLDMTMDP